MADKTAYFFGCKGNGHYLFDSSGRCLYEGEKVKGLPWPGALRDTGLLKNGKHQDIVDGKVFWTCGGRPDLWFAFFWWDRSEDKRGNSSSGFYVKGFVFEEIDVAFSYACGQFPDIVARQKFPLVLQDK